MENANRFFSLLLLPGINVAFNCIKCTREAHIYLFIVGVPLYSDSLKLGADTLNKGKGLNIKKNVAYYANNPWGVG